MIMGHMVDTAFLLGQKPISPHSEHSVVLPLTPHTISNRQTCQKEKCMINYYDMAIFISYPISTFDPYLPFGPRADMGVLG